MFYRYGNLKSFSTFATIGKRNRNVYDQTIIMIVSVTREDFWIVVNHLLYAMCSLKFVYNNFSTEN